jgi:hypothetical protein
VPHVAKLHDAVARQQTRDAQAAHHVADEALAAVLEQLHLRDSNRRPAFRTPSPGACACAVVAPQKDG